MEPHLLFLVSDLMQDRGLRFDFNQNPRAVMRRYGLRGPERNCLLTMNRKKIARLIARQFKEWGFPDDGVPVKDECLDPGGSTDYPSPVPQMFRVIPASLPISTGQREFRIHGQSFSPDAKLELTSQTSGNVVPENTYEYDVRGTYRCSEVFVYFPNPIAADTYDLKLLWGRGKFRTLLDGKSIVFT